MPFIRVTEVKTNKVMDLNLGHIVSFEQQQGEPAAKIFMSDDSILTVQEDVRRIRAFILKAEGKLPEKKV